MATQLKIRRDTAANWTTSNPILAQGEPGLETDTKFGKWGDGTTAWSSLVYSWSADISLKSDRQTEPVTDLTIASNLTALNVSVANIGYIATAPTAAFTLNLTNAETTNGKALTVSLFVVQGATGYIPSALQVAGTGQTIKWSGGTAPAPTSGAGKIDIFSFSLVRRGSAWTVFGSALANF